MATVLLASSSVSRHELMNQLGIAWQVATQTACELSCDIGQPIEELVIAIARAKASATLLPQGEETLFLITADTLCVNAQGKIYGKPANPEEASAFLRARRGTEQYIYTGLCVRRIRWEGQWRVIAEETRVVRATALFDMSDAWISRYLAQGKGMHASGGFSITDGMPFVREIHGSYSAIIGLPLYELRESLENLGFQFT